MSLHNLCSLLIFCLICCLAHFSHNGSGSAQVLQNLVADICLFSLKHGSQNISVFLLMLQNHNSNLILSKKNINAYIINDVLHVHLRNLTIMRGTSRVQLNICKLIVQNLIILFISSYFEKYRWHMEYIDAYSGFLNIVLKANNLYQKKKTLT